MVRDYIKWDDTPVSLAALRRVAGAGLQDRDDAADGPVLDRRRQDAAGRADPTSASVAHTEAHALAPPRAIAPRWRSRAMLVGARASGDRRRPRRARAGRREAAGRARRGAAGARRRPRRAHEFPDHASTCHIERRRALCAGRRRSWCSSSATAGAVVDQRPHEDTRARRAATARRREALDARRCTSQSNYQDFQRYSGVDLAIAGDAQATLPTLIDAVRSALTTGVRRRVRTRAARSSSDAHDESRQTPRERGAHAWDASPITHGAARGGDLERDRERGLVARVGDSSSPGRSELWAIDQAPPDTSAGRAAPASATARRRCRARRSPTGRGPAHASPSSATAT